MRVIRSIFGVVAPIVIATTLMTSAVGAQTSSASGLRISPTRSEITVDQGEVGQAKFNIKNITSGPVVMKATIFDFEAQENGSPKPLTDGTSSASSIKGFVVVPSDKILATDESVEVVIPVSIPSNQAPGAYYGVMMFQGAPVDAGVNQGPVSLTGSVGGIILINVPGEITESMQFVSLKAGRISSSGGDDVRLSNIFAQPFDRVQTRVKNTGSSFLQPFGRITVSDWRAKEVYSFELNNSDPQSNVLPGTERVFTNAVQNIKSPGRYTITAGIAYGNGGDVLVQKVNVWYIPVWLVIVVFVGLGLIIFGLMKLLKRAPRK